MAIPLSIISPRGEILKKEITSLYIPAFRGKAGILEHHLPYISALVKGEIRYTDVKGNKNFLYLEKGFLRVSKQQVIIISNSVEKGEDIIPEQVKKKLEGLEKTIRGSFTGETSPAELERAINEKEEWTVKSQILDKVFSSRD